MHINFNNNDSGNVSRITKGSYEHMLKERAKHLDHIREGIQNVLSDYDGTSIAIIVMKEDENGMPDGHKIFMGGLARPEMQLALSKALHESSTEAIDLLVDSMKSSGEDIVELTEQLIKYMKENK